MRSVGKGLVTKHYSVYAVICVVLATGAASAAGEKDAAYYYHVGDWKKAVELDPTFAKAYYNMARTYLRMDMVREAIDEFNLYLKYGDRTVFIIVAPKVSVESEIEQLEYYLKYNPPQKPASGQITR